MSQPNFRIAKEKELNIREIPYDTQITYDNKQLLLTKQGLIDIANKIAKKRNKAIQLTELDDILEFIRKTAFPSGKKYPDVCDFIANLYLKKKQDFLELNKLKSEGPEYVKEYQMKEINTYVNGETQFQYANIAENQGPAFVGAPVYSPAPLNNEQKNLLEIETMQKVNHFLEPSTFNDILGKLNYNYTTYNNVSLQRQSVPLDSRYRILATSNNYEYSWNLNPSGIPGQVGNIRTQRTIKQIIQMNISSFTIPAKFSNLKYPKIRLFVKEFISQSNIVTLYQNNSNQAAQLSYYHFEFNVTKNGDLYNLEPINHSYSFMNPVTVIETITISLYTPFDLYYFQQDRAVFTVTYGNPTIFTYQSNYLTPNQVQQTTYPLLSTGDTVYILDVIDPTGVSNYTIDNLVNRQAGWTIVMTGINQFTIPVDTSVFGIGQQQTNIGVYFGNQRIYFPIEFVSLN